MPKRIVSAEQKTARVFAALAVGLVGVVVAAQVSDAHHPQASADDQSIAAAVTAADPTPPASILPTVGPRPAPRPVLVSRASGDPLLAQGFGGLKTAMPARYANLTVFPVYRSAPAKPALAVTTLDAAMGNGIVSVVEPNLTVTNAGPQPTYVPGGTVVPGGNQDQGVADDAVVPAQSRNVELASFCVEAGRSEGPSPAFRADTAMAIPAVRYAMQSGDQEAVWSAVAGATDHFGVHSDTRAYHALDVSAAAQTAAQPYVAALTLPVPQGKVLGAVIAINGKIVCADVYRDPALFAQLWPGLLRSYALQAAMRSAGEQNGPSPVTQAEAAGWVASLDAAPGAQRDGSSNTEAARVGTAAGVGVRTVVTAGGKALFHEAFWTPEAALTNRT